MLNFLENGKGEILNLFFQDSNKEYYFREIARRLGKEPSYYQKSLNELVGGGILIDAKKGNMRFFKLNKSHLLYSELKDIISKTIGVENKLKILVDQLADVEAAFIFGSYARSKERADSDIDLMLIGGVDQNFLTEEINKIERTIGREINCQVYAKEELLQRLKAGSNFLSEVFSQPMIILKGDIKLYQDAICSR